MRFAFDGLSNHSGIVKVIRHLFDLASREQSPSDRARLSDALRLAQSLGKNGDLFDAMGDADFDTAWAHEVRTHKRAWESRGFEWELGDCCFRPGHDGYLGVAMHVPSLAEEVSSKDVVNAGFAAVWTHEQGLSISPRVFRQECSNGMVGRAGSLGQVELHGRPIADAIDECLLPERLGESVEALRHAKEFELTDPLDELDLIENESVLKRVMERYREGADETAWGLGNAVTAEARFEPHPQKRFDLERIGARILYLPVTASSSAPRSQRKLADPHVSYRRALVEV